MSVETTVEPARLAGVRGWALPVAIGLGLILFPLLAPGSLVSIGFVALQYVLFALGLNIIVGWIGLLDLGAAGFVAVGAYATAILMTRFGMAPVAVLPLAAACGFAAGITLGIPTLRHRADYFAVLTLGFAELVALCLRNWTVVTGGSFGYSGIPATRLPLLSEPIRALPPTGFYYFALSVASLCYAFVFWLRSTSLGRRFHVVKDSEEVAQVYGVRILAVKLAAFGVSAALLALGGFFWAAYQRSIIWTEFNVLLSCLLLSVVIIGGVGSPNGVVVGAAIIGSSLELLRRLLTAVGLPQNIRYLIFATGVIVVIHLRPSGLLSDRPSWVPRLRRARARRTTAAGGAISEPASEDILHLRGVVKSFGGVRALQGVSLKIRQQESVALIGPNGSGKTTLLNVVSGLITPDGGSICIGGRYLRPRRASALARYGVARSFQDLSVSEDLSVEDNVYVTAASVTSDQIDLALSRFGLPDPRASTSALAYGQKKALDLARLFVNPARMRLVLLDEPTAGLNRSEAMKMVESLATLRAEFRFAMVVVSHDIMFLEALQLDRVVVMHQGNLFREGSYSEVRNQADVRRLFWGDDLPT